MDSKTHVTVDAKNAALHQRLPVLSPLPLSLLPPLQRKMFPKFFNYNRDIGLQGRTLPSSRANRKFAMSQVIVLLRQDFNSHAVTCSLLQLSVLVTVLPMMKSHRTSLCRNWMSSKPRPRAGSRKTQKQGLFRMAHICGKGIDELALTLPTAQGEVPTQTPTAAPRVLMLKHCRCVYSVHCISPHGR